MSAVGNNVEEEEGFQPESTKEIRRVLNSISQDQYEPRHYAMVNELRVRKMLAREKINYPTKESFNQRKKELSELFKIFNQAT